jgi:hypothetical protein
MNATVSKERGTEMASPRGAKYRASEAFHSVINDLNEPVNVTANPETRPLSGWDIDQFRVRHKLTRNAVADALALVTPGHFNRLASVRGPLKFELELLLRLYAKYPTPAPWISITPKEMFERFYGPLASQFGNESATPAKTMLFARFAALFGRYTDAVRRWVVAGGKTETVILRAMTKLADLPNPREVAEDMARRIYALRGLDFDDEFPLPDPKNPPMPGKRGPVSGRKGVDNKAVVDEAKKQRAASKKAAAKTAPIKSAPTKRAKK